MDGMPEEARLAGHVWLDLVSVAEGEENSIMRSLAQAFSERFDDTGAIRTTVETDENGMVVVHNDFNNLIWPAVHIMTNLVSGLAGEEDREASRNWIIATFRQHLFGDPT